MKIVAIITEDFSLYYDLVKVLKRSDIPFVSLSLKDTIPPNVGIVLTTEGEAPRISFQEKISIPEGADVQAILNEAKLRLRGQAEYGRLVIGVDPGVRPGFAVVAGGNVLYTTQTTSPEEVGEVARGILSTYPAREVVIRVGHGDPTNRNRIINALHGLGVLIEIVDEQGTTKRTEEFPDIKAAINIAMSSGTPVSPPLEVSPTNGELKNLQRQSRELSGGQVTISTHLAERVARGELSLQEAVDLQRGGTIPVNDGNGSRRTRTDGDADAEE